MFIQYDVYDPAREKEIEMQCVNVNVPTGRDGNILAENRNKCERLLTLYRPTKAVHM